MDMAQMNGIEEHGETLALCSGTPISFQDTDQIWIVLEGKLDLYLAEMRDGEPAGPRHHFMRVEPGNPVIGFAGLVGGDFGVIVNPTVNSKVLRLWLKDLRNASTGSPESVLCLVNKWAENLGSVMADKPVPKTFQILSPGTEILVDGTSTAIFPLAGVVWVRHQKGTSVLLGDDQMLPIEPGRFFPVTRWAWLDCAAPAQVGCLNTRDWLDADPQWLGLHHFQEQVLAYLVGRRRRDEQKERARLRLVAEVDANAFESALYKLANPFQGEQRVLEMEPAAADPLLQVCRLVGSADGIQIPLLPHALELISQRDPVSAIAQAAHVQVRPVMLKGDWWRFESSPMIAFLDQDKLPVALLPGRRGYQLYDPVTRAKKLVDEQLAAKLRGLAYVFYRPFPPKSLTLRDVLFFGLKNCGADAATIFLMGIAAGLLGMITPVFTGIIFDTVIPGSQRSALTELSIFLVLSSVATALFTLTRNLATLRLETKMEASIQAAVWDRLLALPIPFFRNFTSGDLARRSLGISQIREALAGAAMDSILTGMFSIASCVLMFSYSWRLALIAAGLVLCSSAVFTFFGLLQVRILRDVSQLGGRIAGITLQFINGVAKFRVAGTEARAFAVWAHEFTKQRVLAMRARKISNVVSTFNAAFPVLIWTVIYYSAFALQKTSDGPMLSTGAFLAFLAAFTQFSSGAMEMNSALISVLNVIPLYERAKPILASMPEVVPAQTSPPELTGSIDLHHVSFRYRDAGPLVLRDLSLSISAGQFAAFVGPSGSGKSTVFRLLLGFETPGSGAIHFDGQDLTKLDVRGVRRQIGVVLQNARLLTGSIYRNIVGDGTLTLDDAWAAARLAGLEEDLKAMPMGMHTMVSEGGGGLSGGQRQRLLIARAIIYKPRIVLFDEATSALDNHTQAIVSRSLKALNATRVVIAHRLSTVRNADRIYVFNRGSLAESGSYDALMAKEGLFSQLAKRQLN